MNKSYTFRFDKETIEIIDALASEYGLTRTDIIKIAVRLLAKEQQKSPTSVSG